MALEELLKNWFYYAQQKRSKNQAADDFMSNVLREVNLLVDKI